MKKRKLSDVPSNEFIMAWGELRVGLRKKKKELLKRTHIDETLRVTWLPWVPSLLLLCSVFLSLPFFSWLLLSKQVEGKGRTKNSGGQLHDQVTHHHLIRRPRPRHIILARWFQRRVFFSISFSFSYIYFAFFMMRTSFFF